jgi:hypothetical protein
MFVATPAMPEKPNTAATIAMMRNTTAQLNIAVLLSNQRCFRFEGPAAASPSTQENAELFSVSPAQGRAIEISGSEPLILRAIGKSHSSDGGR